MRQFKVIKEFSSISGKTHKVGSIITCGETTSNAKNVVELSEDGTEPTAKPDENKVMTKADLKTK